MMDWDFALGGDFPARFWDVFSGTLDNFLGAGQNGPLSNDVNGILPFVLLVCALMFANKVIEMFRRITEDGRMSAGSVSDRSEGFRNE